MVTYMGKQKQCTFRNGLIGGVATLGLLLIGYSLLRVGNQESLPPAAVTHRSLPPVAQHYNRTAQFVHELKKDPDFTKESYSQLAELVFEGFEKNPEYANQAIRDGLESLSFGNEKIERSTYLMMFDEIRNKAESTPELMDHFGERAKLYMEQQVLDSYLGAVHRTYGTTFETLQRKSAHILDVLEKIIAPRNSPPPISRGEHQ